MARWRNIYSAVSIGVVAVLLLLRGPADRPLTALGDDIGSWCPQPDLSWLTGMLAGILLR